MPARTILNAVLMRFCFVVIVAMATLSSSSSVQAEDWARKMSTLR